MGMKRGENVDGWRSSCIFFIPVRESAEKKMAKKFKKNMIGEPKKRDEPQIDNTQLNPKKFETSKKHLHVVVLHLHNMSGKKLRNWGKERKTENHKPNTSKQSRA